MINIKNLLKEEYGEELADKIVKGYSCDRPLTIRLNTLKMTNEELESYLNNNNISYEKTAINPNAYILKNSIQEDIEKLAIYEEGKIYFQSLSSQLPPLFMDLKDGEQVLDMAAAPGGKTTEMANLANVMITACEKNKIRCERLKYNIAKQGSKKINVLQIDARNLDDFFSFDKILLDAPCSGSGTLSEPLIDEELINRSMKTQEKLLEKAIKLVKKDGIILYSTCSVLKEENENIIKKHLGNDLELIPLSVNKELPLLPTSIEGVICLYPDELYEGFFVSLLKKIK